MRHRQAPPSRKSVEDLFRRVRVDLHEFFDRQQNSLSRPQNRSRTLDSYAPRVCISLRANGKLRGCAAFEGSNLRESARGALGAALRDLRHGGPVKRGEIADLTFEIALQTACHPIRSPSDELTHGDRGLEVRAKGTRRAFFLPSVPILSDITSADVLVRRLLTKANIPLNCEDAQLFTTTWSHYAEKNGKVVELRRCRPVTGYPSNRDAVLRALTAAMTHALAHQHSDGTYSYRYNLATGLVERSRHRPIRVISVAYALSRVLELVGDVLEDESVAQHAQRSAFLCIEKFLPLVHYPNVVDLSGGDRKAKTPLGVAAILLLAMQHSQWIYRYHEEIDFIVDQILKAQNREGWFPEFLHGSPAMGCQRFYPGEALLALARMHARTRTIGIERALKRAFPFYESWFKRSPDPNFAAWHVKAWSTAAASLREKRIARFVFDQLDYLDHFQRKKGAGAPLDYVGGFTDRERDRRPPSFISASFTEALIHGAKLARLLGVKEKERRYATSARLGLSFLLRLQVSHSQPSLFPQSAQAVGAFTRNLASFDVRCDFGAHAMTCLAESLVSHCLPR